MNIWLMLRLSYRQTSNIRRILVGNKIVDNSDVVGASPVGAAPTASSFSTYHLVASMDCAKSTARKWLPMDIGDFIFPHRVKINGWYVIGHMNICLTCHKKAV